MIISPAGSSPARGRAAGCRRRRVVAAAAHRVQLAAVLAILDVAAAAAADSSPGHLDLDLTRPDSLEHRDGFLVAQARQRVAIHTHNLITCLIYTFLYLLYNTDSANVP